MAFVSGLMATPRSSVITIAEKAVYMITCRCARQAFSLESGLDLDGLVQRKRWIEDLALYLTTLFMCRMLSFNFMDNHMHLELMFDPIRVEALTDRQVAERVFALDMKSPQRKQWTQQQREQWIERFLKSPGKVDLWRQHLCNPSKFMAYLNETIAKRCNKEDGFKGHFWQDRFHCIKLVDAGAVIMAMNYIELNQVRAKKEPTLEESLHSSIHYRLQARELEDSVKDPQQLSVTEQRALEVNRMLAPIDQIFSLMGWGVLDLQWNEYEHFLREHGRRMDPSKRGRLDDRTTRFLERYGLAEGCFEVCQMFRKCFGNHAGSPDNLRSTARKMGVKSLRGTGKAAKAYAKKQ